MGSELNIFYAFLKTSKGKEQFWKLPDFTILYKVVPILATIFFTIFLCY